MTFVRHVGACAACASVALSCFCVVPASSAGLMLNVSAPFAQPPSPSERRSQRPFSGAVWDAGHWDWVDGRSTWVGGHWMRPDDGIHAWRHGYWEQSDRASLVAESTRR